MEDDTEPWKVIDPEELKEGDTIRLQHKDCADSVVGWVVLKSPDGWTFMLSDRITVYSVIDWYIAVLQEK